MDERKNQLNRREFINVSGGTALGVGMASMFSMHALADDKKKPPAKPKTNFDKVKEIPRTEFSLPGLYPGKVSEVTNSKIWTKNENEADFEMVRAMLKAGMEDLTGKKGADAWRLFVNENDIIGLKVNPVGGDLISTRHELMKAVIEELLAAGIPKKNLIIWDRCAEMLTMGGYTKERYPDIALESMHVIDLKGGNSWKDKNGKHVSISEFDMDVFYWADILGPDDDNYLNQNVFNGKESYFGKLVTQKLTKIINLPVLKNSGNGVSMASKNLGYAAVVNTNRLHKPLGYDVNVEVLGFPCLRDKMVLNILDGLKGQYEGGPMPNAKYIYNANKLLIATDPYAQDYVGYKEMLAKRKADTSVKVNESPRYTGYLKYAEKVGLGVTDPAKIKHNTIKLG